MKRKMMFSSFHSTETLLQVKDRPAHLGPADASVSKVEECLGYCGKKVR